MASGSEDGRMRAAVLVVDNDPEIRQVLARRLSDAGYSCVTAASGAQALAEWHGRTFDVVVTDLNMPGGDGIALADALQRSEQVPIVFITGFREDFKRRIRSIPDAIVLEKPFDGSRLIELVDAILLDKATGAG